jgi:hypothetical protein
MILPISGFNNQKQKSQVMLMLMVHPESDRPESGRSSPQKTPVERLEPVGEGEKRTYV